MKNTNRLLRSWVSLICIAVLLVSCAGTPKSQSTGELLDSAAITAKVKAELALSDSTSALQIDVETYKNEVILSGFVESENERLAAGQIASAVSGVKSVKNSLVVK